MSTLGDITFWRYEDPIHDAQIIPATPGVTPGWVVIGDMDQAWSVPFAVLTAPDGSQAMEQTGDAVPVTIVDDHVQVCWCGADGGEGCHCCTDECPEDCEADHRGEQ